MGWVFFSFELLCRTYKKGYETLRRFRSKLGKNRKRLAPFCSLHKKFHDDDNEELFLQNRWSAKSVKSCLTGMTLEALDITGLLHSAVIKRSLAVGWIGRHSWNFTGGSNGGTKMPFISYKKTTTRVDDRLDEDGVLRV